jgi:hypothetical protein
MNKLQRLHAQLLSPAPHVPRDLPSILEDLKRQLAYLKPICGVTDGAVPSTTPHHTNAGGPSSSTPHFNTGGAAGVLAQLGDRTATTQRRVRFEEDPTPALEPATLGRRKRKASSAYGEDFGQMESSDDEDAEIEEPIMAKKSKRNAPKAL